MSTVRAPGRDPLAITWWGHSSMSIELAGRTVATDPLLGARLVPPEAFDARPTGPRRAGRPGPGLAPAPRPPAPAVAGPLRPRRAGRRAEGGGGDGRRPGPAPVARGGARRPGRGRRGRHRGAPRQARRAPQQPRQGVRRPGPGLPDDARGRHLLVPPGTPACRTDFADIAAVDLAAVPIGGWGPTLGHEHLHPEQAAAAVDLVGARWSLAVHYGHLLADGDAPAAPVEPPAALRHATAAVPGRGARAGRRHRAADPAARRTPDGAVSGP